MTWETLEVETGGDGVAHLWMNRPGKHNALSAAMIGDLAAAAAVLGADPAVRVVVLGGRGRSFCAGGDLDWMRGQMAADDATRAAGARALAAMLGAWDALPKGLIGRVQGRAFGGGLGMMAVCDAVVAEEGAAFGLTEVRLGLIPATIGPYVTARIGAAAARRHFASGRPFDAGAALAMGLASQVRAADDLDAGVADEAGPWLAAAPGAVAAAKAQMRGLGLSPDAAAVEASVAALLERWRSDEAAEGIGAFFERRPPRWTA